jgi:hypothetical protein
VHAGSANKIAPPARGAGAHRSRERAPERCGADRRGDGTGGAGGGGGRRGEGPAQRASHGDVHPHAAACCARTCRAHRTGAWIELDSDVLVERAGEKGRTAAVGGGRCAECEWDFDLDPRGCCCCQR